MNRAVDWPAICARFSELLTLRFNAHAFTTEDSVRYTFFLALIESGIQAHEILLESPHPRIDKAEIDLLIQSPTLETVACEFKYSRAIPSGMNAPRTQHAGVVFKDLFRLALVTNETARERLFVYLTGSEMATYFTNAGNGWYKLYDLPLGDSFEITQELIGRTAFTFQQALAGTFTPTVVEGIHRASLPEKHELRVFRVHPM